MKLLILILLPVFCLGASHEPPTGPQGPEGTFLRYNLLDPFPGGRLGAFNTRDWEPGTVYIFRNFLDFARMYLQLHYDMGVFGNVYLSAGQH